MKDRSEVVSRLLLGLFDDASLFPPAELPMPAAVAGHARHLAAWYRDMTGPFVCPDTRIAELGSALAAAGIAEIDVSMVVTGGPRALPDATAQAAADRRIRLRAVEVPVRRDGDRARSAAEAVTALAASLPAGSVGYVELPLAGLADGDSADALLGPLAEHGYRPKLRTGGVTAAAFPDEATLAAGLLALIGRDLAFKCTAGLHHAVRHAAADTGFQHHGFVNVLLAVAAAAGGADQAQVAAELADQDAARIAARLGRLDQDRASTVRGLFTSFGTCSTDEPVADLIALGLAEPGDPEELGTRQVSGELTGRNRPASQAHPAR